MNDSLWVLDSNLRALEDKREELEAGPFDGTDDERLALLSQCDIAIHQYLTALPEKVDGIRGWWRHCEMLALAASEEAKRQAARGKAWGARLDRLKAMCCSVMDAAGLKKLEGNTGYLSLKSNGGKQPVIVTDPALVPDEFCEITVTMSAAAWAWTERICRESDAATIHDGPTYTRRVGPRTPRLELIRAALEARCGCCVGTGQEVFVSDNGHEEVEERKLCRECGGTGKQGVPGAYLEARQKHVECR